jgi:Rha family phage regulatory protein
MTELVTPDMFTDSLIVAEKFDKRHDHVIVKIRSILSQSSEVFPSFREKSVPTPGRGRPHKVYEMTRDGFCLLAMGFTGARAMEWKLKFLKAFNEMEARLKEQQLPAIPKPDTSTHITAACRAFPQIVAALGHTPEVDAIHCRLVDEAQTTPGLTDKQRVAALISMVPAFGPEVVAARRIMNALPDV